MREPTGGRAARAETRAAWRSPESATGSPCVTRRRMARAPFWSSPSPSGLPSVRAWSRASSTLPASHPDLLGRAVDRQGREPDQLAPGSTERRMTPLYVSTAVSVAGDGAFNVAVPLLAAAITTNPVAVGVVTACFPAPWLLVGLFAGALSDRWPRRRVMILSDLTRAALLSVLGLATGASPRTCTRMSCPPWPGMPPTPSLAPSPALAV